MGFLARASSVETIEMSDSHAFEWMRRAWTGRSAHAGHMRDATAPHRVTSALDAE